MFHRVRPEAEQDQEKTQSKPAESAPVKQAAPEEKKEEISSPKDKTETSPKTNAQKDTKDMSEHQTADKTEDQTEETAQTSSFEKTASAYQRPGQAPVQTSPYTPSYAGASSYAPAPAAAPVEHASTGDRTLTIGPGITMSGEIESCDYLLVEGTVEAALKGASLLEISETGTFYGTVEISEATVAGRFEGDITVHGRLTIRSGGVITGTIAYKELEVESGAIIDGRLTPVSAQSSQAAQPAKSKAAPAAKKAPASTEDVPAPANTDGELFSSKTAS